MRNVNDTSPTDMVVDHSEDSRELVWLYLTQLGYHVIEAANGARSCGDSKRRAHGVDSDGHYHASLSRP
jgi:CheY-like chemotaxis protein